MKWQEFLGNKKLRLELAVTILLLAAALVSLANFLNFVETRNGIVLPDPLLNFFRPVNLTWLIFGLIYISLFLTIFLLAKKPEVLLIAVQSYILIVVVRIAAMMVVPLNPPQSMIPLNDPFVQFLGTGRLLTKDLFFSGHTATLFLFYLAAGSRKMKLLFLLFTAAVAISVIVQHVHYTIDVLSAPFFTYGCNSAAKLIHKKINSVSS